MANSPTIAQPSRLFSLPPELRNTIYEMVFQPELATLPDWQVDNQVWMPSHVNILESKPPPKDLLSTCRQIHNEAAKLYKSQYRKYWTDTTFYIDVNARDPPESLSVLEVLDDEDLSHVHHLVVRADSIPDKHAEFRLLPNQKGWSYKFVTEGQSSKDAAEGFCYLTIAGEEYRPEYKFEVHVMTPSDLQEGDRERFQREGMVLEGVERLGLTKEVVALGFRKRECKLVRWNS